MGERRLESLTSDAVVKMTQKRVSAMNKKGIT